MEKMAGEDENEEDTEYESDPEEIKMSLKLRRREASDDDDFAEDNHQSSIAVVSDGESDGQGAAAEYDVGDDDDDEDDEDDDDDYYDDEQDEFAEVEEETRVGGDGEEPATDAAVMKEVGESRDAADGGEGGGEGEGDEKKENEPFAVPTSGAFYMHDDRFKDNNGAGRHRRTFGGRRLWESKDDRKWGHDKFEEMNMEDRHYEGGRRSSRASYRGRGKTRGTDRGYTRGSRMKGYVGNSNQSAPPKDVRGRGPRRYQPSTKNRSETLPKHNRQSGKLLDKISYTDSGRVNSTAPSLNVEHEQFPAKKVASNLNSASPPFYPSGSSNKDIALTQKKEVQAGNHSRNIRPATDHGFFVSHSNNVMRGKNVGSMGMDKLHIDDSVITAAVKPMDSVQASVSPSVGATQIPQLRAQGRGVVPSGSALFQTQTSNQNNKVSSSAAQSSQRIPLQSQGQSSQQATGQQLVYRPIGGPQTSAPPKGGLPLATFEPGNFEFSLKSGKSKVAVVGKGKGSAQGIERDAPVFGGAQVTGSGGNMSTGHGDPNLPAFFPVMQFGGQHPRGIPAVGMAFPGYVARPNGLGNSEMTWLPVLSGALGGSYCPPYLAVDGQTSALPASSKDINELKLQQRSDVANDEISQRQNKPRRYSEMNFSQ